MVWFVSIYIRKYEKLVGMDFIFILLSMKFVVFNGSRKYGLVCVRFVNYRKLVDLNVGMGRVDILVIRWKRLKVKGSCIRLMNFLLMFILYFFFSFFDKYCFFCIFVMFFCVWLVLIFCIIFLCCGFCFMSVIFVVFCMFMI